MNYSRNLVYIIHIFLRQTHLQIYKLTKHQKVFVLKNNVLSHVTGPSLGSDRRLHAGLVVMFFTFANTLLFQEN
jgi:hypothetical protein